jgi:hypothetical protein
MHDVRSIVVHCMLLAYNDLRTRIQDDQSKGGVYIVLYYQCMEGCIYIYNIIADGAWLYIYICIYIYISVHTCMHINNLQLVITKVVTCYNHLQNNILTFHNQVVTCIKQL